MWGIWKIEETEDELLDLLQEKEVYKKEIAVFSLSSRRKEWLAERVLLKELIGDEKQIIYTESGAPTISDSSYRISISNTKNYVAVMADKYQRVGIDIEYISSRVQKIKHRFMSEQELQHIGPFNEDIHLLLHWSAKESMFKALGETHVDFMKCLHITPFIPIMGEFSHLYAHETKTENHQHFTIHYMVDSEFVITFTHLL